MDLDDIENFVDGEIEDDVEEDFREDLYSDNNLDFVEENKDVLTLSIDFGQIINRLRDVIRMFKKSSIVQKMLKN